MKDPEITENKITTKMDTIIIVMEIQNNTNQCQITIRLFDMKMTAKEKRGRKRVRRRENIFFNF